MQEDHQKEYEEFTNHHKKTLEKFLQGERSKTSIKEVIDTFKSSSILFFVFSLEVCFP